MNAVPEFADCGKALLHPCFSCLPSLGLWPAEHAAGAETLTLDSVEDMPWCDAVLRVRIIPMHCHVVTCSTFDTCQSNRLTLLDTAKKLACRLPLVPTLACRRMLQARSKLVPLSLPLSRQTIGQWAECCRRACACTPLQLWAAERQTGCACVMADHVCRRCPAINAAAAGSVLYALP